ncbi:MAG TPA: hypothetical protein VLW53_22935, partial [Candidatus Eisenbacteria bacterium]|nr:hypothetical protein [Candidatus Eisenbacteria bacterium]
AAGSAAAERTLPLSVDWAALLPAAAVQRGSVLACAGDAAAAMALSLVAGPSQHGAWTVVAGMPGLGLAAAAEAGVVLERLVAVTEPAGPEGARPFTDTQWADLLAACIDGFDVVVLGPAAQAVRPGTARRLVARLQSRGAVAVTIGAPVFGGDLRFECVRSAWAGLGDGHGVAQERVVRVELSGRRVPRVRRADLWLPAADGRVRALEPAAAADTGTVVDLAALRRTG